ncbi:atp dependent lon protease family member [Holotrichia oblita]|nr:atp dependent lon protease family member [Holotrichia oblita]
MAQIIETVNLITLPAIITRGIVLFPELTATFDINRKMSIKALEYAEKNNVNVFCVCQKDIIADEPNSDEIFTVGTEAKIKQIVRLPNSSVRVLIEGVARAEVSSLSFKNGFYTAEVYKKKIILGEQNGMKIKALTEEAKKQFDKYMRYMPRMSNELYVSVHAIKDCGLLADLITGNLLFNFEVKQSILEKFDPYDRLELLCVVLQREIELLNIEEGIHNRVREQIDKNQRDYFLREQLKVIQNELGGAGNDFDDESSELYAKINNGNLPVHVMDKLNKELNKMNKMPAYSSESSLIRSYIDTCLEIPWNVKRGGRCDIEIAESILEREHYGLEKIKQVILEFIAVRQKNPEMNSQILCFVGPPGVGKTSIATSIAKALDRDYVRISLGGVRDEADIRGHRKTYIGAMPGRIVTALKSVESCNPLILFDEIDKLTRDSHGDPASALLEVLDVEQNKEFRDHFIEMPIDLSGCVFITTANNLDTIPRPLIDRMEIITLPSYTRNEKFEIAKQHLLPKQLKKHGVKKTEVKISGDALFEMIDHYTKEAGVRNLEREIAALIRKSVKKMLAESAKSITVNIKNLSSILGKRKFIDDAMTKEDQVGVVNGLAWTSVGGDILQVEVLATEGTGKIELTGSLGDVMKESARTALSFIRSIADKYNIQSDFHTKKDIHINFPEGAIPKDGPSAGITMATAIFSELTGLSVRSDVAMTGEITLRGRVLPIGGLKEKTVAACRAKIKTVIIPNENEPDLEDVDVVVKENVRFVLAKNFEDVLQAAIIFSSAGCKANGFTEMDGVEDGIINLPGYGYANRSAADKAKWSALVEDYFKAVNDVKAFVVQLADLKIGPTKDDLMMLDYMAKLKIPYIVAATKADKLNATDKKNAAEAMLRHEFIGGEKLFVVSANDKDSIDRLRDRILTEFTHKMNQYGQE